MTPEVSIIVPVYNDAERLNYLLDSLVKQSYSMYEIIIVDNGSTDKTPKTIETFTKQYSSCIQALVESRIKSSYAARNKGITVSRGHILAFIDSDCIADPFWLEAGVNTLKNTGASCAGGMIEFFFRDKKPNLYEYYDSSRKLNQEAYVNEHGFAATANFFARRDLFKRYGYFNDALISGGDYEFGTRVTRNGEKLVLARNAIVRHPARSSLLEILKKTRRIARGEKVLVARNMLQQAGLSWRQWRPAVFHYFGDNESKRLSLVRKCQLTALKNICKYVYLLERIR